MSEAASNWYPDPLGRGEYRYWDGERWTNWISAGGRAYSDPDTDPGRLVPALPEPSLLGASPVRVDGPPPGAGFTVARFRSIAGLSVALTWLLAISVASAVLLVAASANRIARLDAFENDPTAATFKALQDADDFADGAAAIVVMVGLAVFVLLIVFLHRASKNTETWDGASRTWTPGWAIAGWFIPLANVVIPPLVVADTWRRTPAVGPREPTAPARPGAGRILLWWVPFAVGAVLTNLDIDAESFDEARTQDALSIAGAAALAVAAVVLIVIVRTLARRQHAIAAQGAFTAHA